MYICETIRCIYTHVCVNIGLDHVVTINKMYTYARLTNIGKGTCIFSILVRALPTWG